MTANVFCTARDEVRATRLIDEMCHAGFKLTQCSMFVPEHAVAGGFGPATLRERGVSNESPPAPGSFCELLYDSMTWYWHRAEVWAAAWQQGNSALC